MKEVQFIRKNKEKWLIAEKILKKEIKSPNTIVEAYEGLSADLAFVLTHYPNSDLADYLNCLTLRLHNRIYGKRKHKLSSLVRFFSHDVPLEMYRNRKFMLISIVIFAISTAVGVLSQYNLADETTILGKDYVEMSLKNIEKGAPMAVYGSGGAYESFWLIALNNIKVAILAFVSGVLTCFYTGFVMVKNGVMLGAFITLFSQHGELVNCLKAVWLHGVVEISSIIISGGAGLALGSGWLFPGSYPRITSFVMGARSSVKIVVALVPFFFFASFIESYITRLSDKDMALPVNLAIIFGTMALILLYFVYLPVKVHNAEIHTDN